MEVKRSRRSPGRPRTFDADAALERAMRVFWEKGFEGASLAELTEAMGINPPSLYAAFGNKAALFRKVLKRYGEGPGAYVMRSLREPTARSVAERRLYGAVETTTARAHPRGCLQVQAIAKSGAAARKELVAFSKAAHDALRLRFERAQAEGDLPPDCDPEALARYIGTVAQGIAVQAAAGVGRRELREVVRMALQFWPKPSTAA